MFDRQMALRMAAILLLVVTSAPRVEGQNSMPQLPNADSLGLANQELVLDLLGPISTRNSKKGDKFSAKVLLPVRLKDAIVEGEVTRVVPAKRRKKATIQFEFYGLVVGNQTYSLAADLEGVANSKGVKNVDDEGQVIGTTSHKKEVFEIAVCAAGAGTCYAYTHSPLCLIIAAGCYAITQTVVTNGSTVDFQPGSQFTIRVRPRQRQGTGRRSPV